MKPALVSRSVTVAAPPSVAFRVFTAEMTRWWPLATHHIGAAAVDRVVIEPKVGGRWYEQGVDGSTCDWGHVVAWEPPGRLLLTWEISADWKADAAILTEVEVRFTAVDGGTRVDLEHRKLDAYGAAAAEMTAVFDSEGGWAGMLGHFSAAVAA